MQTSDHVSSFSGHYIFCRQKEQKQWMMRHRSGPQSYSWPTEPTPQHIYLLQDISDSQFGSNPQLFAATFQDKMAKVALLLPAEAIISFSSLSQYNGLLPSPHPLQLLALPSFSPSGYLRQRQAAADRTVQAREQLGKRGRDSWTCRQLHLLWPGTTRTHKTSLMGWSQYYSTT